MSLSNPLRLFCLVSGLLLLAACAAPVQRANVSPEEAQQRSADRFWQHVDEAGHHHDWFHLLNDHEEAMRWRLAMIDSAHHAIDMETFLWSPDQYGHRVLAHLLAAADRGVRVRLLLDDSFTPHQDLALHRLDSHPNIDMRLYNPYGNRAGGTTERTLFNLGDFQRVNHRMHNKALVVDGWLANVGGRNMADEYFGLHDDYNFRDMEVLTMGGSVAQVAGHFAAFWNSGWAVPVADVIDIEEGDEGLEVLRAKLEEELGTPEIATEAELEAAWQQMARDAVYGLAHFVADRPAEASPALEAEAPTQVADYIIAAMDASHSELVLVSAYLVPTQELLAAIERATARGVRVRILTNSMRSNNHISAHAAYSGYVRGLVTAGVELYELRTDAVDRNLYMQTPVKDKKLGLHAKFMLLDEDRVFIGSSNLDRRSLNINTEVGMMVNSAELNRLLRDSIAVDFEPRNAWLVRLDEQGDLNWVGDSQVLNHPPADSPFQQLEDWFIGLLPIDAQM